MALLKFLLLLVLLTISLRVIHGHGKVMEPVNRSSAFRKGFATPENYEDNQLYCGGGVKNSSNIAVECGVCGDDPALPQPRPNENGGLHGTGLIVKTYKAGQTIKVTIDVNANHAGNFYFALCPLTKENQIETEDCFRKHPLYLPNGSRRFKIPDGNNVVNLELVLPDNFTCKHCVLRWHWRAGNSWGYCTPEDLEESDTPKSMLPETYDPLYGELGCGSQEVFRSCSDIAIASELEYRKVLKEVARKNDLITKKLLIEKEALAQDEDYSGNSPPLKSRSSTENPRKWKSESFSEEVSKWQDPSARSWEYITKDNDKCTCTCNRHRNENSVYVGVGRPNTYYRYFD